jgi:putative peptidoglycan lipid II flippase
MAPGIVRQAATVGTLTALSRIFGMMRDIVCAGFFGAGMAWDVFVIAFSIPNMFRHLFGEGALSSAFIPAFVSRKEKESVESAGNLLNRVSGWMMRLLGGIAVVGMASAAALSWYSPDPKLSLISETVVLTLPYLPLICVTAILGAALNGLGRFASPAAAPILLNLVLIASAFLSPMAQTIQGQLWILSAAVLVGGISQFAIQLRPLSSAGIPWRPSFAGNETGLREVMGAFLPAVVGLGVIQINELLDNVIAEAFVPGDGAVSAIYYANRLNQLPLGIIGFSIATAAFPKLSSHAARGEMTEFSESLRQALRLSLWIAIPAAAGLLVLAPDITALLFERGMFDAFATARTFPVVLAYAVGIPFYAANMVLTRAFYSLRDMKTPVRISLLTVGLNLILNLSLVTVIQEPGIALATSATGIVNFVLLVSALRRRVPQGPRDSAGWLLRTIAAAALAAAAALSVHSVALPGAGLPEPTGTTLRAVYVGAAIVVAVAAYGALSIVFRLSEARQILASLRRPRG